MITGFRTEPMQDVDTMWESDASAEWERQNEDTPEEEKYMEAAYDMKRVWETLSEAVDRLAEVADGLDGTPGYDRIVSLIDDLEEYQNEVMVMKNHMEKGCI